MAPQRHPHDTAAAPAATEQPTRSEVEPAPDSGAGSEAELEAGLEQDEPRDSEQGPPPSDGGGQAQQELDELTARAAKADEYLALAQRAQADFENYRKRAVREAGLAQERGIARLAKELLPALDHLNLALKAASEEDSQLAEGIKLVQSDLLSALQRVGVEPFAAEGEQFDPQFHEAVAQQPIEGVESGLVAEVFQQGYRLGESVLRPARVLVAA